MTEWLLFHFSLSCIGEGNGNPLQCSCLENPRDGEAWWATIYGVAQSQTRLKRLSSSSREKTDAYKNIPSLDKIYISSLDFHGILFIFIFYFCPKITLLFHKGYSFNVKSWLIGKDSDGRDWGQEEKGTTEDEMAGWHHWLNGCESGWTPGVGDGQGGLACCDSWGHKVGRDWATELKWTELKV